jgi:hypothetical protein
VFVTFAQVGHRRKCCLPAAAPGLALFDGVSGVRDWMAAAYKPAATLGSCMQDMMHNLKAGLEILPNVTLAS